MLILLVPIVLVTLGLRLWIQESSKKEGDKKERSRVVAYIYQYEGILKATGFLLTLLFVFAAWNYKYVFNVVIEGELKKEVVIDA
ncbi:hypothetical protein OAH12_00385, partial [Cyclobacteriaceae bacterium]|nr:hypothetical protein [Cyclobacteriaceae bacterium]